MSLRHNFRKLSNVQLTELIGLCCAVAILIGIAVFISHGSPLNGNSQSASLFGGCGFFGSGGCAGDNASPAPIYYFYADPTPAGQTTTLHWSTGYNTAPYGYQCVVYGSGVANYNAPATGQMTIGPLNSIPVDPSTCSAPPGTTWNLAAGPYDFYGSCNNQGYELSCGGNFAQSWAASVAWTSVNVGTGPIPSDSITGNGQAGSVTVGAGTPVVVAATYTANGTDSLQKTAINDNQNNLWCGSGNNCTAGLWTSPPLAAKSYTFTPTTPGSYVFYPAMQTANYSSWDSFGQSLTVVVNPSCPAGQHWQAGGFSGGGAIGGIGGSQNGGQCVPDPQSCPVGQVISNGVCTSAPPPPVCTPAWLCTNWSICSAAGSQTCTGATDTNSCGVSTGNPVGSSRACTPPPPTLSLTTEQARVQKGSSASLSWSVLNLTGDPTVQCAIASNPSGVFSKVMLTGTTPTWSGTNVASGPIMGTTIFTLSCTGSTPVSKTVTVVPTVQEL